MTELTFKDFSIITPVYNGATWIEETIESVLKFCDGYDYEYIVVNDGSTDTTAEILKKYVNQVKVITQSNKGEAASVNAGFKSANGRYAMVVSADDPMRSPELLKRAKLLLDSDSNLVCAYPDWSVIDSKSEVIRDVIVDEFSIQKLIGEFKCIVGPGGVFRLDKALQIGGRNPKYRFTSDYEFWLRLSATGVFKRIPGFLAFWREHNSSTSIALRGIEMGRERISVIENFNRDNPNIDKKIRRMASGYSYYNSALLVYYDKNVPAKKWLTKSLVLYPQGIWIYSPKIMIYIILTPLSPYLLKFANKIGYRKEPSRHV